MWGIRALHPQSFLIEIFRHEQAVIMTKLEQQAADSGRSLSQLLDILNATVPDFVAIVSAAVATLIDAIHRRAADYSPVVAQRLPPCPPHVG